MKPSFDHSDAIARLMKLQELIRDAVISRRNQAAMHDVMRSTAADTIYAIDAEIDPILEAFFEEWGKSTPLVLVAEGIESELGEGVATYPKGLHESEAKVRVIVDPIDGTRGLMYDKRSAWSLAGVAPNRMEKTTLADIEVAAMTELPTSKMGYADVLYATRGGGARAHRISILGAKTSPTEFKLQPSTAAGIDHGFATVSNFFPGTKVLAAETIEHLVRHLIGAADVTRATVFDDQYISTGGQLYELMVGHDRFNADLRPLFYRAQGQPEGMCCHPYDCAAVLIAEEAGVIVTDASGNGLSSPLDITTGVSWVGYANSQLRTRIEPLLLAFLREIDSRP